MAILFIIFNTISLLSLSLLGLLKASKRRKASQRIFAKLLWGVLAVSVVCSLVFQIMVSMHNQTYKSDLVLRYQDTFEDKMIRERMEAAAVIAEYLQKRKWDVITNEDNLDSLEGVLAFFDDLGFYWKNGEVSSTVLYQHFYSDMRTFCQETMGYIHENQKAESVAEWEYVEPLFNELTRIEAKRIGKSITNCVWDTQTLEQYLKSEMRQRKRVSR